jgi:hypothetical protein
LIGEGQIERLKDQFKEFKESIASVFGDDRDPLEGRRGGGQDEAR